MLQIGTNALLRFEIALAVSQWKKCAKQYVFTIMIILFQFSFPRREHALAVSQDTAREALAVSWDTARTALAVPQFFYSYGQSCSSRIMWHGLNQGWASADSLRSSLISALFKRAIARSFALLKRVNERSLFFRSFQKSDQMSDRSFAFSKRATKRAFALSKRATKKRSLFRSFKKSEREKMSEKWAIFQIAHFSLKKKSHRSFSKWANAQPCPDLTEKVDPHHR